MKKITVGVAPVKRAMLSMETAKKVKEGYMKKLVEITPPGVSLVTIDDICENGIAFEPDKVAKIVEKFKQSKIDALFLPFCDFGEETVAAGIASELKVPTLVWGARDEYPNSAKARGRDTQCGMFAATKVLRRYGVKYSYIENCPTDSETFLNGYISFLRTAAAVAAVKGLRIAKFGNRPDAFMSVISNEGNLLEKYGIVAVPISIHSVNELAAKIAEEDAPEFQEYCKNLFERIDSCKTAEKMKKNIAAVKMAMQKLMRENRCTAGTIECWPSFEEGALPCVPCVALGELADEGMPVACEGDINGAVTLAILDAVMMGEGSEFFADLTIRHPENENAELLWHCGPFPYSLKSEKAKAGINNMGGAWELKKGGITLARFDDADGEMYLFAGEGKAVDGPETTNTYVWFETKNWKEWEEKLIFGPYIHHVGGVYGSYSNVLREVARYLDVKYDTPGKEQIYSL